jgi:dTDP-4-amino-4,6-dideoxygalactose transaminase
MSPDVIKPLNEVIMSGYITQGKQVEKFETNLQSYLQNPYVLTLNSATAGLTLATKLLKQPDERFNWTGFNEETDIVLTPALTCFATTAAILANNANIQWIDADPTTCNIDFDDLKSKLSEKTKIIYLVHWGGNPVDLDKLKVLQEYSLTTFGFKPMIVEDCAHAFGAEYNGKKIGCSDNGNICVFSLQAIKHLTTGDGGIITLPNEFLYEKCKLLRWYGIDRDKRNYKGKDFRLENDIVDAGYKAHMNDINATIGLYNLPHVDDLLIKDRINANYFNEQLGNLKLSNIILMENNTKCNPAWWLYSIRVINNKKHDFMTFMKEKNIMISQVHNRNDINSCVQQYQEKLPNLDQLEKELVCIPVGWWLSDDDKKHIISSIKKFDTL